MGYDDVRDARTIAQRLTRVEKRVRRMARSSQSSYRSVELVDGPQSFYDESGVERLRLGGGEEGVYTIEEMNGGPPPQPTSPVVVGVSGGIAITYDGTYEGEESNVPGDFARTEVHVSETPDFVKEDITQVASFVSPDGGEHFFAHPGGVPVYVALVAVNRSGVESVPSVEESATAIPTTSADQFDTTVEGIESSIQATIDSVKDGTIFESDTFFGTRFIGALFETDENPNRGIKITTTGVIGYDSRVLVGGVANPDLGDPKTVIDPNTGLISSIDGEFVGAIMTGGLFRTAASGQRLEISQDVSAGLVQFFTGDAYEISPGSINPSARQLLGGGASDMYPELVLSSGSFRAGRPPALIRMEGPIASNPTGEGTIAMDGDVTIADVLYVNFVDATSIRVGLGGTKRMYYQDGASSADTPNASGIITLTHSLGIPGIYQVFIQSRDNGAVRNFTVTEKNANNFKFRVENASGNLVTSGSVTFDWWLIG